MLFVLLLSIFTAILTVLDTLILATIFLVILTIIGFIQKRIKLSKRLVISGLSFFVSILSVRLRQSIYTPNIPAKQIFGTAKIVNIHDSDSYIIDYQDQNFFLETDKKFQIGDNIFLAGNIAPGYTGNILDIHTQRQNLTKISDYKFSYAKRLISKNIQGTIYPNNITIQSQKDQIGLISQIRTNLKSNITNAYGENRIAGLILGMLIGDKTSLPSIDYESFKDSGLVHIIAVSGGNIVMIVIFLSFILFFLPFYVRIFVIFITIIFYALICGLDSSVLRATIMGGLGLLALLAGRNLDKWRILTIAYVSMLVYNPYYLAYDIGFLFSFSAVIGIIVIGDWRGEKGENEEKGRKGGKIVKSLCSSQGQVTSHSLVKGNLGLMVNGFPLSREGQAEEKISTSQNSLQGQDKVIASGCVAILDNDKEKIAASLPFDFAKDKRSSQGQTYRKDKIEKLALYFKMLKKYISIYLIPSLGATIGIFPFMMFFIGKLNLISIFGNLLILPIIPFVMIYGFISTFLFNWTGRHFIIAVEKILIKYIFRISELVARFGIYLNIGSDWLKYALLMVFLIWIGRQLKTKS